MRLGPVCLPRSGQSPTFVGLTTAPVIESGLIWERLPAERVPWKFEDPPGFERVIRCAGQIGRLRILRPRPPVRGHLNDAD
jgi:hypothetical protein